MKRSKIRALGSEEETENSESSISKRKLLDENIASNNSVFHLIFPNQWKSLLKFAEEIFEEYDEPILSQRLNGLSPHTMKILNNYYIAIPPNSPKLKIVITEYHDSLVKSLHSQETTSDGNISSVAFKQYSHMDSIVDRVIELLFSIEERPKHVLCFGFSKLRQGSDGFGNMTNIQSFFPNSLIELIKSNDWEALLSIVGDCVMSYMLQHGVIVKKLQRDNFLQVAGKPLQLYCTNTIQVESVKKHFNLFPAFETIMNTETISHISDTEHDHAISPLITQTGSPVLNGGFGYEESSDEEMVESHNKRPSSQTNVNTFLPRQMAFYSNKKTPLLGFPQSHVLNSVGCDFKGAKLLFNFIFHGKKNEEPDTRFTKGYGVLLNHLLTLKQNQKKLKKTPYILSHYCPLKPIRKNKLVSDIISIKSTEQPILFKKMMNHHPRERVRFEDVLCTQDDMILTQMEDDDSTTLLHIQQKIESEVLLNSSEQFESLVSMTQPPYSVSLFIKSIVKKLIPLDFFGSEHNREVVFNNIDKVVQLGRYETLTLHELMQDMRIKDLRWTYKFDDISKKVDVLQFKKQTRLAEKFIFFLFKHIVLVLMGTHFYITESDQQRMKLLYFRRETWEYISRVSWSKLNEADSVFKKIDKEEAVKLMESKALPYTSVRLLPKQTTARPIINLGKRLGTSENSFSVNSKLRDLLFVLKFECDRNNELLGSSVFNPIDMYKRLLPFVKMWKEQIEQVKTKRKQNETHSSTGSSVLGASLSSGTSSGNPSFTETDDSSTLPLYVVKIDIKGAYDSIPHEKLYQLICQKIITEEEYIAIKFNAIRPYIGKLISKYERLVLCPNTLMRFTKLVNKVLTDKYCKTLLIDQVSYSSLNASELKKLLHEHIFKNIIKVKNQFYIQIVGIPQGGIISPLLCSLLYADFESSCLKDLPGTGTTEKDAESQQELPTLKIMEDDEDLVRLSLPTSQWNYFSSSNDSTLRFLQLLPDHIVSASQQLDFKATCQQNASDGVIQCTPPSAFMNKVLDPFFSPIVAPSNAKQGGHVLSLSPPGPSSPILQPSTVSSSSSSSGSFMFIKSIGVLLRLIDDFLYITTNKTAAQLFLERMNSGNVEYGLRINPKKTKVNFDTSIIGEQFNLEYNAEKIIRWCGFNIDTSTLHITIDYSRYWDCHLREKISKDCKTPGLNLCRKLKQTISWKCSPLIIDSTINSTFIIYLNIYQLFLFVAMKFHSMLKYKMKRLPNKHPKSTYTLYGSTISDIIGYMWICILSRKKIINKAKSHCDMERFPVKFLGICAFHKVLQKKHVSYAGNFHLVGQLRAMKNNMLLCGKKELALLKQVTDRRYSRELLDKIKY